MKKEIEQIIEAGELKIEMRFIDFENRINEMYSKMLKKYE